MAFAYQGTTQSFIPSRLLLDWQKVQAATKPPASTTVSQGGTTKTIGQVIGLSFLKPITQIIAKQQPLIAPSLKPLIDAGTEAQATLKKEAAKVTEPVTPTVAPVADVTPSVIAEPAPKIVTPSPAAESGGGSVGATLPAESALGGASVQKASVVGASGGSTGLIILATVIGIAALGWAIWEGRR